MLSYDTPATVNGQMNVVRKPKTHHIWLVTGPAGCGKSTVAEYLASQLNLPYIEGDKFHSPSNVAKMRSQIPLTDEDRWDWLTNLREESTRLLNEGQVGVVMTCSALKRKYRDVIRVAGYYDHDLHLHFIYLHATEDVLEQRVRSRIGHYMPAALVRTQLEALQPPSPDETDCITIDATAPLEEVKGSALQRVRAVADQ